MTTPVFVDYNDLLMALDWVSSGAAMENAAFVCLDTGTVHWVSADIEMEDEVPDDIETSDRYLAIPDKRDLDLGRNLALRFADELLPGATSTVQEFFRHPGAYANFKAFLEHQGRLQSWYDYEARAIEQALREWSQEQGIQVKAWPSVKHR